MRWAIMGLVMVGLPLSGCSDPAIDQCERFIKTKLRSPSTFKAVQRTATRMTLLDAPQVWVQIAFDASNAYGTPVRDTQVCKFPVKNGKPDTSQFIDFDAQSQALSETEAARYERLAQELTGNSGRD